MEIDLVGFKLKEFDNCSVRVDSEKIEYNPFQPTIWYVIVAYILDQMIHEILTKTMIHVMTGSMSIHDIEELD